MRQRRLASVSSATTHRRAARVAAALCGVAFEDARGGRFVLSPRSGALGRCSSPALGLAAEGGWREAALEAEDALEADDALSRLCDDDEE